MGGITNGKEKKIIRGDGWSIVYKTMGTYKLTPYCSPLPTLHGISQKDCVKTLANILDEAGSNGMVEHWGS